MSKKQYIDHEAVFKLKPIVTDDMAQCDVKHQGYVSSTDKLGDEPVEIKTTNEETIAYGKNTILLGKFNGYEITVNAYRNNIIGNFLLKNTNWPVCSLQFMYSKNIVTGYLFNVFIYFALDPVKNAFLKRPKDYVGARVYGKYFLVMDCDKELIDEMPNLIENKVQKYALEDVAIEMENKNYTEQELTDILEKNIAEKKEFYEMLTKGKEIKLERSLKNMMEKHLFPIYQNKHIGGLIKFGLEIRQKKRVKEYGAYESEYKIPERVLKISDVLENPDVVDKFIDNEE